MTDKKKGNAFTNNPIVKAIGVQRIVVVIVLILLVAFFAIASPTFRRYSTLLSIMDYTYYLAFLGMGVTFCLITAGVDLSIGTGMFCYALAGGYLIKEIGAPVVLGCIVCILFGMLVGLVNGLVVTKGGHAPFLATLCMMMIVRGLGSIITGGASVTWPLASSDNGWIRSVWKPTIGGTKFPLGLVWVLLLAIVLSVLLSKTKPGRYIIAIGSNKEAARLSGVKVDNYQMLAYIISGFCTGLAAIAYGCTFQSLAPGNGAGIELNAIGGAIIGGTSMSGGTGSIAGTLLGIFIMSILQTGLPLIGIQSNYQQIIIGIVLLVAVYVDVLKNKKVA